MKGYLYTMFKGADPACGWRMTDPLLGEVPTLGACVPNIRRAVAPGDHIFVVSGRVKGQRQYVVGGFEVSEKIRTLAAYERFPQNRQRKLPTGELAGNIIITSEGSRSAVDYHSNFDGRLDNYVVGKSPIALELPGEVEKGREQSLEVVSDLFKIKAASLGQLVGHMRRLDEEQIERLRVWLQSLKQQA